MTESSSILAWILFFYIYCFLGWCVESTYVSCFQKKWVNRGFLHGPYIPIYGTGALLVTYVTLPVQDSVILTFFVGAIAASILEYVTGALMESIFQVRYWDYSDRKFNINGHVCLLNTLEWGFLTVFLVFFLDRPVADLVNALNETVQLILIIVISLVFWSDVVASVKAAFDVRDMIIHMTEAREEINRLQKRLDVLVAVADDSLENWKESRYDRMEGRVEALEERLGMVKEGKREELESLREKLSQAKTKEARLKRRLGWNKRGLLRNNPTATSRKFKEAFEELAAQAKEKRKQKEN
jgi:uncharacterized membrane protein